MVFCDAFLCELCEEETLKKRYWGLNIDVQSSGCGVELEGTKNLYRLREEFQLLKYIPRHLA